MSTVYATMAMSLDGYVAGPNDGVDNPLGDGGDRVHEWMYGLASWVETHGGEGGDRGPDDEIVREVTSRMGATIMGRRMFDHGEEPWGDDPPFHVPVFVVTHRPREVLVREGGTTFTFVTEGIERAMELAREAAGDKDVQISGGARVVQQYLEAGLLDELQIHVAPIFLGGGVRLFEGPSLTAFELQPTRVVDSPSITHIRYRVVR
jgi:dihydrofolate reductase